VNSINRLALMAGPLCCLGIGLDTEIPAHPTAGWTMAVAAWMVIWWMFEVVPLGITALLPIVLFPAFGIASGKHVATAYINHVIFLFIGGFLVAIAMQQWNLHRRIAYDILLRVGSAPWQILLGFMLATAFLSMWISNTATTMMMVPIALAVLGSVSSGEGQDICRLGTGIMLGIAYAASIGGIATLVGTPPNLSLARIFSISFPDAPEIAFSQWMLLALPVSLIFLVAIFAWLAWRYLRGAPQQLRREAIVEALKDLGPVSREERWVAIIFAAMAALWITRSDLQLGSIQLRGWASLFEHPAYFNDGVVAIAMALLLFLIPAREGGRLLGREAWQRIPWDIVLLFGGGFALATGIRESGTAAWIAAQSTGLAALPPLAIVAMLCLAVTFLTELTSNTATAETLLPVVAALSVSLGVHPLLLMAPATISCSLAFMLPVATPPNAIVFGSGLVRMRDMVTTGLLLNLIGVVLVTAATALLGGLAFGYDLFTLPAWALLN